MKKFWTKQDINTKDFLEIWIKEFQRRVEALHQIKTKLSSANISLEQANLTPVVPTFDFHFIHNYKVMGTTIYAQLPVDYCMKYYGHLFLHWYESLWHKALNRDSQLYQLEEKVSLDHLHLDELIELNVTTKEEIESAKCLLLVREPLSRFMSMCHYENKSPTQKINELKKINLDAPGNKRHEHWQYPLIDSQHDLSVEVYKMKNYEAIIGFFKEFGIPVNCNLHQNRQNEKKYYLSNLSQADIDFLKDFYRKDYELFQNAH